MLMLVAGKLYSLQFLRYGIALSLPFGPHRQTVGNDLFAVQSREAWEI